MLLAILFFAASWVAAASFVTRLRVTRDVVESLALGMAGALILVCWLPFLGSTERRHCWRGETQLNRQHKTKLS